MITFAEQTICLEDVKIFREIEKLIDDVETFPTSATLSCHILAHAVGEIFSLPVEDGYWKLGYNHSWLRTERGNIIDVYPVATVGGPILIAGSVFCPELDKMYFPADLGDSIFSGNFRADVEVVKSLLSANRE